MLLADGRVDPTLRNSQGRSAAELARNRDIRNLLQAYSGLVWNPAVVFPDISPENGYRALKVVATETRPGKKDDDPLFVLVFGNRGRLEDYSLVRRSLDGELGLDDFRGRPLILHRQSSIYSGAMSCFRILKPCCHPSRTFIRKPSPRRLFNAHLLRRLFLRWTTLRSPLRPRNLLANRRGSEEVWSENWNAGSTGS